MVTLQHTFGILLLVCSVAVALPQERRALRRGTSNHYEEDSGHSEGVPGNSEESVPVKYGRTIYSSAWSTEDTDSSEEKVHNDDNSIRTGDNGKKRWSLSNILQLALNFVNKLRGEFVPPVNETNSDENVLKSTNKKESDDAYLQSFKKWLRKNKVLNKDDSISSHILKHGSHFNHYNKRNQVKPRKKSFKNFDSSKNKNHNHNEKRDRMKNSKSHETDKHDQQHALKRNHHGVTASKDVDEDSKNLSTLLKTNQNDNFSDEDCESSETPDKDEPKDSKGFINPIESNKIIKGDDTDFIHLEDDDLCDNTSAETPSSSNSESDEQDKSNHQPTVSSLVSDSSGVSPKQQETVESIQPNDSQNTSQNQNILNPTPDTQLIRSSFTEKPMELASKNNLTKKLKPANASGDISLLNQNAAHPSSTAKSNTTRTDPEHKQTRKTNHEKLPKKSKMVLNVSKVNIPFSLQPPSKDSPKECPNKSQIIESIPLTAKPEHVPPSETQGKRTSKGEATNSQVPEKEVPLSSSKTQTADESVPSETSNSFPVTKSILPASVSLTDSPYQPQEENILKGNSNDSQVTQNLPPEIIPASSTSPKPAGENISKENQNEAQGVESVPHVTMPISISSTNPQDIRALKDNSKDPHVTKKVSQAESPSSSSTPQAADKNNLKKIADNNLPVAKNISQKHGSSEDSLPQHQEEDSRDSLRTKNVLPVEMLESSFSLKAADEYIPKENQNDSLKIESVSRAKMLKDVSPSEPQVIKTLEENSDNSQAPENVSQTATPVSESSAETAGENQNDSRKIESVSHEKMLKDVSPSEPHVIRTLEGNSGDSQAPEKVLQTATPTNESLPETAGENITAENQSNSQGMQKVPLMTMSNSIPSSAPNGTLKGNSNDSQMVEKVSQPAILESSSSPQTADETITKEQSNDLDLPMAESVSQATEFSKPLSVSSYKPQNITTLKEHSEFLPSAILVDSSASQTGVENIIKDTSTDFREAKSVLQTAVPVTDSLLQLQKENTPKEGSNDSQKRDSIIKESFSVSQLQPQAENISKGNTKDHKVNERVSSPVIISPESNEKHILKEIFEPKYILTKPDETSLKTVEHHKSTEVEKSKVKEIGPNDLLTKHKDSDIAFSGDHNPDKLTLVRTTSTNKDSNYDFEHSEMDSSIVSDETDPQNNKNTNTINLSDGETNYKLTSLGRESSTKYPGNLKQKSKFTKNLSFISSSREDLSSNEMEDEATEKDEQEEKFDTFLQYIYKHSNSSYFQALREKSNGV